MGACMRIYTLNIFQHAKAPFWGRSHGPMAPGLVQLYFGQSSASRWKIRGTSPVFIDSRVPVQLKATGATGATGIGRLRAPKIREDGDVVVLYSWKRPNAKNRKICNCDESVI